MKQLNLFVLIFSLFLVGNNFDLLARGVVIPDIDGDGEQDTPYLIDSANGTTPLWKLNKIADWVNRTGSWDGSWKSYNRYFKLCADISGFTNTIGTKTHPFYGIFDGNHHIITVNIYKPSSEMVGLFGQANHATITQLTVAGSVRGSGDVGGVLGWGINTTITFCTNVANVLVRNANGEGWGYAGGIAGSTSAGLTILNCVNAGTIQADWNVGGIIGYGNGQTTIISCINTGTIRSAWNWAGGIIGNAPYEVENCLNAGFVYSNGSDVGGIVGRCEQDRAIKYCINTGVVHGYQPAGAIAGYMPNHSQLYNNYYDKQMCTKGSVAGDTTNTIAIGLNTYELTGWNPFGTQWQVSGANFYPVPTGGSAGVGNRGYTSNTPYKNECMSKVAAASIELQSLPIPPFPETTDNILARFFMAYHPDNTGTNTWTAKNGTIKFVPPPHGYETMWNVVGPARTDTMVATCGNYSKFVPLNIPRAIYRLTSETNYTTNTFSASEVTPNIVTSNATIDIQTSAEGNLNVSIYDLAGTKVANVTDRFISANTSLQVDLNNLSNLSTGSYMAVVSVGNEVVMRKFVKG